MFQSAKLGRFNGSHFWVECVRRRKAWDYSYVLPVMRMDGGRLLAPGFRELAILVVYIVPDGMEWLLRLHLQMIERTTKWIDYRIFGVALRISDEARGILESCERVRLVSFADCPEKSSKEHSYYLDSLTQYACEQGFRYFLTLDVDSFPIRARWFEDLTEIICENIPFAAVLREENRDINLPHPSGLLCATEFYRKNRPRFYPHIIDDEETKAFLEKTAQRPDTGIGFAAKADALGLDWLCLRRTNKANDHYLMGGVYGDTFFHLGSMGRLPRFFGDWVSTPYRAQLTFTKDRLKDSAWGREKWQIESKRIAFENDRAQEAILARLSDDSESYIEFLRHGKLSIRSRLRHLKRLSWR